MIVFRLFTVGLFAVSLLFVYFSFCLFCSSGLNTKLTYSATALFPLLVWLVCLLGLFVCCWFVYCWFAFCFSLYNIYQSPPHAPLSLSIHLSFAPSRACLYSIYISLFRPLTCPCLPFFPLSLSLFRPLTSLSLSFAPSHVCLYLLSFVPRAPLYSPCAPLSLSISLSSPRAPTSISLFRPLTRLSLSLFRPLTSLSLFRPPSRACLYLSRLPRARRLSNIYIFHPPCVSVSPPLALSLSPSVHTLSLSHPLTPSRACLSRLPRSSHTIVTLTLLSRSSRAPPRVLVLVLIPCSLSSRVPVPLVLTLLAPPYDSLWFLEWIYWKYV